MSAVTVNMSIKFRIFGVTLGTAKASRTIIVPALSAAIFKQLEYDDHGVKITVTISEEATAVVAGAKLL